MGRLPQGSRSVHVNASHGPDTNIMKFYITSNSNTYGKSWENFKPQKGRHTGTGYLSNFRPGVYYSRRLDEVDNPVMADIVSRNYNTVTKMHFQPYRENSGKELLPLSCHQVGSGFVREKPLTTPIRKEVTGMFIDTRVSTAPSDILPRYKPLLQKLQTKDPVELENCGYGPNYMSTETKQQFTGKPPDRVDISTKTVSGKEGTGFTHACNIEPITFHPDSPHKGDKPGWHTHRPTGISMMTTSFMPSEYSKGNETFQPVAVGSERGTGFTREKAKPFYVHRVMEHAYDRAQDIPQLRLEKTKKTDPTEFLNMKHPNNHSSIAKDIYLGYQRPRPSESDRLARTHVGSQELSGYCENNDRFIQTADNLSRFITHYNTRFYDKTPQAMGREGHCRGGVQDQLLDGFTKSTAVHEFAPEVNTTETLRRLQPYVARSLRARDQFFDDHLYDKKLHRSVTIAT